MDGKQTMNDLLYDELTHDIQAAAGFQEPVPETRYHKQREYLSYGLPMAELWRIMKSFRPQIMAEPLAERLDLATRLLGRHIGEFGHAGIYVIVRSQAELWPINFPYLDQRIDDFRSWSHVDYFCGEVMQPLLGRYRAETLAQLDIWSRSPNRFKRRISVVTFARKVGASGRYTAECLAICDKLIWDPEDIVQKGVGWALKENYKAAPDTIVDYVKQLRRMGVPSTITLYAIRDLKGEARQEVLAVKKQKKGA
jgi:3-methyladenine DNA glycosylase AlkD